MLRGVKSLLAIGALVAVGVALRWVTAGTITTANSHDLDSLTVLAVGAVAWVAYSWLVLAVLATALEQLPGALGAAAGVFATRITSTTSRALLRSALGVAAVTPLTVGVAHAASPHGSPPPQSGAAHPATTWRTTEPRSSVQIAVDLRATEPRSSVQPSGDTWRATEPRSSVDITADRTNQRPAAPRSTVEGDASGSNHHATQPRSSARLGGGTWRTTESRSSVQLGATGERSGASVGRPEQAGGPRNGVRAGAGVPTVRPRGVPVPDRPEVGAATRYTGLRSGVASRVTVAAGDSLWGLAARELGPRATEQEIAARWPQWYAANRQVIGSDPNLILPGQVLRVPPTDKEQ
ncbi:LysM peptidoglycan-binding domain-containing protein [Kribbella yunnanensis]|uniref:LysM peptidoglycan-binding domain-containing protein n=1 Tax=Kribbella yunnanensis TaxID=190194 RepID=A0ABP4UAH0_9ACTN